MSDIIEERKKVGALLRSVRVGDCSVKDAMLLYPKDVTDEGLIAVYHALIHYEADEDIRHRDALYKQEQDDYIEFLSELLLNGQQIPQNIINNYKNYYETAPILHNQNFKGFLKSFWKDLNIFNRKRS